MLMNHRALRGVSKVLSNQNSLEWECSSP